MRIDSFIKRLNATELGEGVTNDTYIAIPRDVDLSDVLVNNQAMTILDLHDGNLFTPQNSNIKYVKTGQNNQERISGLGQYFRSVDAHVGDEVIIERIEENGIRKLYIDFNRRNVIVFQKNKDWVEVLNPNLIEEYAVGNDYSINVTCKKRTVNLLIKYIGLKKKKKTSPNETPAYDLIIDNKSILSEYDYLDFIEISADDNKRLARMKTFVYSTIEI